jgi:SAM-dependent methyltransferase
MRRRIAPTLHTSQDIYENVLKDLVRRESVWLDVGCGHQILPEWREKAEAELSQCCGTIVGIDYDLPSLQKHRSISLRVRGDISRLPFQNGSFDLVTANMVVEHLDNPRVQFEEISRILKPGGLFLFHTPNALGYFAMLRRLVPGGIARKLVALLDGREPGDVFPVEYRANTRRRIGHLATSTGLEVDKTKMIVSESVFQLVPPLAFFELIWIRALMTRPLAGIRTNIIAVLKKPEDGNWSGNHSNGEQSIRVTEAA